MVPSTFVAIQRDWRIVIRIRHYRYRGIFGFVSAEKLCFLIEEWRERPATAILQRLLFEYLHYASTIDLFRLHGHSQLGEYFPPVAFTTGLAVFLGDQSCTEPREGTGALQKGTSAAPYHCIAFALCYLHDASEEVFLVGGYGEGDVQGRAEANSLEDGSHLAGS